MIVKSIVFPISRSISECNYEGITCSKVLGYHPDVGNRDHPASRSVGNRSAKEYIVTTYIVDRR